MSLQQSAPGSFGLGGLALLFKCQCCLPLLVWRSTHLRGATRIRSQHHDKSQLQKPPQICPQKTRPAKQYRTRTNFNPYFVILPMPGQ